MTQQLQILHLSDLHISTDSNFDRSLVLDPLIDRVKKDRKDGIKPELVIVTGDIAFKGIKEEYDEAKIFFTDLLKAMKLPKERLFIVPGNHDVDREKYRPTDIPVYKDMDKLNMELEKYRADLLKGMSDYFNFVKEEYPHIKPLHENLIPFVASYEAECGKKVGLIGLNSAWMCRKSPDREEIAIGEYQIDHAVKELKGKNDLVICAFHHPIGWLLQEDVSRAKKHLNEKVILCGHLHSAEGGLYHDYEGSRYLFQTGAAYINEKDWPERYQYLTFDWDEKSIRLDFRSYVRKTRKWIIDSETGDDGKKYFYIEKPETEKGRRKKPKSVLKIPKEYLEWVKSNYSHLDADKLYGKGKAFPLSLPEIFVPLYSYKAGEAVIKKKNLDKERKPDDIEKIIAESDHLIIEGQAGSGKTTLLKHVAYCLASGKNNECKIEASDEFLPMLILLKDINDFFKEKGGNISPDAFSIMEWYIEKKQNGFLTADTLQYYIEEKKAVILIDGLDELLSEYRESVINAFADLGIKFKGNKIVFSSRPHGIEGPAVKRFGKSHIKIHPLDTEQVNLFINRWFKYLYPGEIGSGGKTAQTMIGEIRVHPAINQLVDNPLMLTAICILYHDEKELPGQRAELYKKFIDNMLYRRFKESEKVYTFLKILAYEMHQKRVRGIDKSSCIEILSRVYLKKEQEKKEEYHKRLDKTFDDIESKCGLLKLESGEFSFWHLTFQEFLTALHIVDTSRDYSKAIGSYLRDDWYKEVIELYIGYLSIDNKTWANGIIADIINSKDQSPFKKWLLASTSLVDIHKDRREEDVKGAVKKCMVKIIEAEKDPKVLLQAGENLGWLGDTRDLEEFVAVEGGIYNLEELGEVDIKPFEIGKYPVTNDWYARFMAEEGYLQKEFWSKEGFKWLEKKGQKQPLYWDEHKWKCPNSPVVGVCLYEADAFCRWLTLIRNDGHTYRLPTEQEWQAAAAGKEGRIYPWGNDLGKNKCNNYETDIKKTSPVGIFENDLTIEGVYDLGGNVCEWTSSFYDKDKDYYVVRGGSWDDLAEFSRCAIRLRVVPYSWVNLIGFRCART